MTYLEEKFTFFDAYKFKNLDYTIKHKFNLNRTDSNGATALILTCQNYPYGPFHSLLVDDAFKIIKNLLNNYVDASIVDIHGKTALMYACENFEFDKDNIKELVELINYSKNSLHTRDLDGKCAQDYFLANDSIKKLSDRTIKLVTDSFNIESRHTVSKFITACKNNNIDTITKISTGLNFKDVNINELFISASGHLETSKLLINFGAEIDMIYNGLFFDMCFLGNLDVAKWLHSLDIQFDEYSAAFVKACSNNQIEVVKWLSCLKRTSPASGYEVYLVDIHYKKDLAFVTACKKGCLEIVKLLYKMRVDIYTRNGAALILACKYGHIQIVQLLTNYDTDNNFYYGDAFYQSCIHDHLNVALWIEKNCDFELEYNLTKIFKSVVRNCDNLVIVKWLYTLGDISVVHCAQLVNNLKRRKNSSVYTWLNNLVMSNDLE